MLTVNYDNVIAETEAAFKEFWKKYSLKKTVLQTVAYAIFVFVFISMIAADRTSLFGWIGTGLCLGFLISLWLRPGRAWKKLAFALELTDEERYAASFFDDRIEVETTVVHKDSDEEQIPEKTTIALASEELYAKEMQDMFLLFVNRSLIYVFPKRCLDEAQSAELKNYLSEKGVLHA